MFQLLCLARLLIRNPHILVVDDIWSGLDSGSLQVFKTVLQKEFLAKTVLCLSVCSEIRSDGLKYVYKDFILIIYTCIKYYNTNFYGCVIKYLAQYVLSH